MRCTTLTNKITIKGGSLLWALVCHRRRRFASSPVEPLVVSLPHTTSTVAFFRSFLKIQFTTRLSDAARKSCVNPISPFQLRTGLAFASLPNFTTGAVSTSSFQLQASLCETKELTLDAVALDTTSPLPLLNSLTHLTYLTSTSPRIREILTCDGGLERLVRLLRDFCLSPPPTENPALIFGLSPIGLPRPQPVPALNPKSFDRHAAYRFSLAFQCVVNIGVRGSEPIRSRVVQAGTLEVVGCILEAWLASKGFAVGPNANPGGYSRESREQRQQRRQLQLEQRQRETMDQVARALTHAERLTIAEVSRVHN